jgi:hypothetical protein
VGTAVAKVARVTRRHTAPALRPGALASPQLYDQLSSTATRLEALRQELEKDLQQQQQGQQQQEGRQKEHVGGPKEHAGDGPGVRSAGRSSSVALSHLTSLLQACSFLRDASASAAAVEGSSSRGGSRGGSRRTSAEMIGRQDSSLGESQEVSLHDDGGAGVGATAAAAVSVALAQSWAAAAGARQASYRHAAAAEGALRPGKARFKLVAAVPRSYRKQQQQQGASREGHLMVGCLGRCRWVAAAAAAAGRWAGVCAGRVCPCPPPGPALAPTQCLQGASSNTLPARPCACPPPCAPLQPSGSGHLADGSLPPRGAQQLESTNGLDNLAEAEPT